MESESESESRSPAARDVRSAAAAPEPIRPNPYSLLYKRVTGKVIASKFDRINQEYFLTVNVDGKLLSFSHTTSNQHQRAALEQLISEACEVVLDLPQLEGESPCYILSVSSDRPNRKGPEAPLVCAYLCEVKKKGGG